jgi:hypothetical protein
MEDLPKIPATREAPKELLENIAEASKNARSVYLLYLGYLAYCALTVFSTTDRQLVLKGESAHLPIIGVNVPLVGFFIVAPLLAIGVFIYYQLHLGKLKRLMRTQKDEYPDTKPDYIYPWIPNIVNEIKEGFIAFLQRFFVGFTHWMALPLVLMILGFGILKKHNPLLSYPIAVVFPLLGLIFTMLFWQYNESGELLWSSRGYSKLILRKWYRSLSLTIACYVIFRIFITIPGINKGEYSIFNVNLSYQKLISEQNEEYKTLYWVDLRGVNLNGADLTGAILRHADLRGTKLSYAKLNNADLFKADLRHVVSDSLKMESALLDSAILDSGRFTNADLTNANFRGARLKYIDFNGADFKYTTLNGVHLDSADLRNVRNLTREQLETVCSLKGTTLDPELRLEIEKSKPELLKHP